MFVASHSAQPILPLDDARRRYHVPSHTLLQPGKLSFFAHRQWYCHIAPATPTCITHLPLSIEALASRTGAHLIWRPVLLGAVYRATNAPQGAAGSASDVFNPTKKAVSSQAFQRTMKRYGIEHNEPPRHPVKTTAALRLLYYVDESQRPALSKCLFRAYWVEGKNVSDDAVLVDVLRRSGISDLESVVLAVENGSFEGKRERRELETATDLAVQRGSPGVRQTGNPSPSLRYLLTLCIGSCLLAGAGGLVR